MSFQFGGGFHSSGSGSAAASAGGFVNKLDGDAAPGVNDDSANTSGNGVFEIGSLWVNVSANPREAYRNLDATATAAVWVQTTFDPTEIDTLAKLNAIVADRNLAADATKLDGIETAATADQTGAEIKTAYEAELDTNPYNDAAVSKLAGIEASATADQTGAQIKTAYEAESDTNAYTDAAVSKLAGIEASADVTDAANVDAAGAVMNTDASTAVMAFVVDEDTMVSDSATKLATQQSIKAYVDSLAGGGWKQIGTVQTASASATIDFTALGSTHSHYKLIFDKLLPATDGAALLMRVSAAAAFDAGTNYEYDRVLSATNLTAAGATAWQATAAVGSVAANEVGVSGEVVFYLPRAVSRTLCTAKLGYIRSTGVAANVGFFGEHDSGVAIDGFRLLFDSGNITSGTVSLWGITVT